MGTIRWKHVLRVMAFTTILVVLAVDFSLAWVYVRALTWPACVGDPEPLQGIPAPEKIDLTTLDGVRVGAWYYPARNKAAVLALGGTGGSLGSRLPPISPLLEQGYGVLQIDSRACATPPSAVTLGYREIEEAAAGLNYLRSRPEIDPSRIGLLGFSMGGVASIRTAARHPEVAAVIAEGGYYNLGGDIVEAGRSQPVLRRAFLYSIAGMYWLQTGINPWDSSPIEELPRISPRPILLIYGELEVDDSRAEEQYAAALEPKDLWIVPGGFHGGNYQVAPAEYARRMIFFFNHALHPSSAELPSEPQSP